MKHRIRLICTHFPGEVEKTLFWKNSGELIFSAAKLPKGERKDLGVERTRLLAPGLFFPNLPTR